MELGVVAYMLPLEQSNVWIPGVVVPSWTPLGGEASKNALAVHGRAEGGEVVYGQPFAVCLSNEQKTIVISFFNSGCGNI